MFPNQMFNMNSNNNQNMNLNNNQNMSLNNNNQNIGLNLNNNMNQNNNQFMNLNNNQNINLNYNNNMNLINNQNNNVNQKINLNNNQNMNLNNNLNMNSNNNQNMNITNNLNMNLNNNQNMNLNNNPNMNSNNNQNMNLNNNLNINFNNNPNMNINNNMIKNSNNNQNMNLNNNLNTNMNNNQNINLNNNLNMNQNNNQNMNINNNMIMNSSNNQNNKLNSNETSFILTNLNQNNNDMQNNSAQNNQQGFNNMINNSNYNSYIQNNKQGFNYIGNNNFNNNNNYNNQNITNNNGQNFIGQNNNYQNQFLNQQNNNLNNFNNNQIMEEIKNIVKIVNDFKTSIQNDINYIKNNVSDIQQKINNANLEEIKSTLTSIKSEVSEFRKVLNEQNKKKDEPKKNLDININQNLNSINFDLNKKIKKENEEKQIAISMNGIEKYIKIKNDISLSQFRELSKTHFKLNDNTILFYYNKFAKKIIIKNELDFKNSLSQNILKYYFTNEKEENKKKIKMFSPINNINNQPINQPNNNFINNFNYNPPNIDINNNIDLNMNNLDNNISLLSQNDIMKMDEAKIDEYKQEVKDVMDHFASYAFIPSDIKEEDFINSAVYLSDMMNKINIIEKKKCPNKLISTKKVMKYPGLITKKFEKNEQIFTLSLISNILEEKGINVNIYKENESNNKIDGANLQYLFNGFTEKKKYEIKFGLEKNKINILLQKGNELNNFIDEWKTKISNILKIDQDKLYLVNPKYNSGFCLDLITNEGKIHYNKLKNFNEIKDINEKPLIEGCQLNADIFDPAHNNQDPNWGTNEKRGGLDYIPPIGWFGYGLKVTKKYDNGNDTWLNYNGLTGEFAVAYFGLSNIYGNKKNMSHFLNEINSKDALNAGYEQIYKNDENIFENSKGEFQKCGTGVYLFQNPKIAENTAGIIDIGGVRYKVLLMCRVNPKKIRQPKGFKDCWILNPLPSEVRPYRILVKKIFQSPLAGASQNEIKTFSASPEYFNDIIIKKDTSFLLKNPHNIYNNDYDYVINLYTSNEYRYINNYLREGKIENNSKYTEKELKSWAWCLHSALTTRKSTVLNGSTYYRGVSLKFDQNLGVGSKFIFGEFTSVSEDKNVALGFAGYGTLFIIRIENNNYPNFYCNKISDLSDFKNEKEILITSNCTYSITGIENKKDEGKDKYDKDDKDDFSVDMIYLTCEGFNAQLKGKKDIFISSNKQNKIIFN